MWTMRVVSSILASTSYFIAFADSAALARFPRIFGGLSRSHLRVGASVHTPESGEKDSQFPNRINATPSLSSPPFFPVLHWFSSRPRIHRVCVPGEAGSASGVFERSQARRPGVRGKWSSPGDVGARSGGRGRPRILPALTARRVRL